LENRWAKYILLSHHLKSPILNNKSINLKKFLSQLIILPLLLKGTFMKSLLFLLFSTTLFAQNFIPDTLYLIDGRSYPCLITSIEQDKIGFIYSLSRNESTVLIAVKRISLEEHGTIYTSDAGYSSDVNHLQEFVKIRNKRIHKEDLIKGEQEKQFSTSEDKEKLVDASGFDCEIGYKKWSFGVIYVPYYSGKTYTLDYSSSYFYGYPFLTSYAHDKSSMEVLAAYEIVPAVKFVLGCGYNSTFTERRYESRYTPSGGFSYDEGSKIEMGLKLLDINVGLKYYVIEICMSKATAFLLLGIGKQFAFVERKSENLFSQSSNSTIEDNAEDFIKSLHSPWYFTLGAGTEYFFDESLSVTANLRLVYSSVSGEYNYKNTSLSQTQTRKENYSGSDLTTRVGFGLNFYF
jgi:hypothetical protein